MFFDGFGRHCNGNIWIVVPHCLMWCIWKERNSRCFEDNERSMPDLKLLFFKTLLDWFAVWRNQPFSSILDLLDLCNFCIWYVHSCILPMYLGVFFLYINKSSLLIKKKKKMLFNGSQCYSFFTSFFPSLKMFFKKKNSFLLGKGEILLHF